MYNRGVIFLTATKKRIGSIIIFGLNAVGPR